MTRLLNLVSIASQRFGESPLETLGKIVRISAWQRLWRLSTSDEARAATIARDWRSDGPIRKRDYKNYQEYRRHQASKWSLVNDHLSANEKNAFVAFRERFRTCEALTSTTSVLCLAARLGTEVRALIDLGHVAIGIDLQPGHENRYVLSGDFHDLQFADGSFGAVYCNSLDHAFDLQMILSEVSRILMPGGVFIVDIVNGYDEGYQPDSFDCTHWRSAREFAEVLAGYESFDLVSFRNLSSVNDAFWNQAVLRKASADCPEESLS